MESHTVPSEPTVSIDALETFVELLSRVESDPSSDAFYSRLCEATCRLADMDRAVIFRYDGARTARPRRRQLRHPARRLRRRPGDGGDRPGRARVAARGPRARDLQRDGRGRARRVPQPDPRVDAGLHADGRRGPLARRDPVRSRPRPAAAARLRAAPAVDAGQDRRAGRVRPPGHEQAGPGPPAAGADGPRARGPRVRDPAAVRHPARVLAAWPSSAPRPASGSPPSCRPRSPTCGARSSARSAAARPRRRRRCWRRSSACAPSTATCT